MAARKRLTKPAKAKRPGPAEQEPAAKYPLGPAWPAGNSKRLTKAERDEKDAKLASQGGVPIVSFPPDALPPDLRKRFDAIKSGTQRMSAAVPKKPKAKKK